MKIKSLMIFSILLIATNCLAAREKTVDIGGHGGGPDEITGKLMLKNNRAAAIGYGWKNNGDEETQIYGDFLLYQWNLIQFPEGKTALYFGGGGRFITYDDDGQKRKQDDEFGLRIPVGIEHFFWQSQLNAFGQFVPVLNLTPDSEIEFGGTIGIRFFF